MGPVFCSEGPVPERCAHLRFGDLHRCLPLHQDLQFLGGRLFVLRRCGGPRVDRCSFQRRIPIHGLAPHSATPFDRDPVGDEAGPRSVQQQGLDSWFGSALMIVSGYYGELVVTGDLTPRWLCWFLSMCFFLYIVYELLVGLSAATNSEPMRQGQDPE